MSGREDAIRRIAEVLAEKYTSPYGQRNPDWDWEKPDGPDNQYYFTKPMEERITEPPHVTATASDGYPYFYHPSIETIVTEVVDTLGLRFHESRSNFDYKGEQHHSAKRRMATEWEVTLDTRRGIGVVGS